MTETVIAKLFTYYLVANKYVFTKKEDRGVVPSISFQVGDARFGVFFASDALMYIYSQRSTVVFLDTYKAANDYTECILCAELPECIEDPKFDIKSFFDAVMEWCDTGKVDTIYKISTQSPAEYVKYHPLDKYAVDL